MGQTPGGHRLAQREANRRRNGDPLFRIGLRAFGEAWNETRRSDQLDYTLGGFIPFEKGVPCNVFVPGRTSIGIDFADALVR